MKTIKYSILALCYFLASCNDPTALSEVDTVDPEKENVFNRTTTFERDKIKRDVTGSLVNKIDFDRYIFDWDVDDTNFIERMPRVNLSALGTDSVYAKKISYSVSSKNRPPVFDENCLQAEDPLVCSTESINNIVKDIIENDNSEMEFTREYDLVTFIIDKQGKILGDVFIAPQDNPCEDCNKVSIKAITEMGDWLPALKDGRPTPVRIQIPIRY